MGEGRDRLSRQLVGTDSHTTMVNGLAVLGWGVGGIEAEAAMLGQPLSMLLPEVIGFKLTGELKEGVTATDLVLTVTQMLRKKGVVGKFVEFYRPRPQRHDGRRPRHHRQHGARIRRDLRLLPDRFRDDALSRDLGPQERPHRARRGLRQGARHVPHARDAGSGLHRHARARSRRGRALDRRPEAPAGPGDARDAPKPASRLRSRASSSTARISRKRYKVEGKNFDLGHGDVVIAAITSCTNTSNPSVMIGAGLLARNAVAKGPHDEALGQDLARAGLARSSASISRPPACRRTSTSSASTSSASAAPPASAIPGPLPEAISKAINDNDHRRGRRAVGQPQFRGARESRYARQLPRLAAARRRLRARRLAAGRPDQGPDRA